MLGFALVYLGEHYVVDLIGGLALTLAVRRLERVAGRPVRAIGAAIERIGRFANEPPDGLMEADATGRALRGVDHTQIGTMAPGEEGMPRVILTRRRAIALGLFVVSVLAFLYFVLPKLAGLGKTWDRLDQGAPAGWRSPPVSSCSRSPATSRCFAPSSCARGARGSTGARAMRSRWPGSPRRACSPPPAAAASR